MDYGGIARLKYIVPKIINCFLYNATFPAFIALPSAGSYPGGTIQFLYSMGR